VLILSITNRGKKWEIHNSLWILWSFTLLLSCVGFFWIGGRTGRRKWIISGLIYLVVNFGLIFITSWLKANSGILYNVVMAMILIGWFAAIVQSFMSRKEYLIRREAVLDLTVATRDAYRNEIREEYIPQENTQPSVQTRSQQSARSTYLPQQESQGPQPSDAQPADQSEAHDTRPYMSASIDLNTCTEQQLANLPGVGVVLAKKAMEMRTETGGFVSTADFNEKLKLMPHFAAQIENVAFVSPVTLPETNSGNAGRVIDM
jgi:DNA uptake protein ComE-like DNA-binding protein